MEISDDELDKINRLRNTPLVAAARYNDTLMDHYAGTQNKLAVTLADLGLPDLETVLHISIQRAMRAHPDAPDAVRILLMASVLDGLAIGWMARQFTTDGVPNPMDPVTKADVEAFDAKMRRK